jgi:hypothetical protein
MKHFIRIEYDLSYTFIPLTAIGKGSDEEVKSAFKKVTSWDPCHIIHYTLDELYDENGELIQE